MAEPLPVAIDPHPLLDLGVLELDAPPTPETPAWLAALLRRTAPAPLAADDGVRAAVRDLLRHGGFKPTGRAKPSSEYLLRAEAEGTLQPIHPLVDLGNAVSLHSGLPISVVDRGRLLPPLRVGLAGPGARYVFNAAGQEIDVAGLLCLHDAQGPCANAVKDAQRTKLGPGTTRVLVLVWGTQALPGRCAAALAWLRGLAPRLAGRA
ncbi:MAG: hypothetical protein IT458_09805 [Planctomycetes bacterium]|nr:hypothetical protein [Planctomycetota bacterium]